VDKSRVEFAEVLANSTGPMALSLDGTTNQSNQKAVVVSVRAIIEGYRIDTFLDLIEVEAEDATTTLTTMLARLEELGMTMEKLKERLVCVTTDGASVMQGVRQGVATQLCQMFGPKVVMVHCYAHRVELVFKAGKENELGVQKIFAAVNDLYSLYKRSGPLKARLKDISVDLGVAYKGLSLIIEVRWLPSAYRALQKVWYMHAPITKHLEELSASESRNKVMLKTLYAYVGCVEFIQNVGFLLQTLGPLVKLSLRLQTKMLNLGEAHSDVLHAYFDLKGLLSETRRTWVPKKDAADEEADVDTRNKDVSDLSDAPKTPYFSTIALAGILSSVNENSRTLGAVKYASNPRFPKIHRISFLDKLQREMEERFLKEKDGPLTFLKILADLTADFAPARSGLAEKMIKKLLDWSLLKVSVLPESATAQNISQQWSSVCQAKRLGEGVNWKRALFGDLKAFLDLLWCLLPTSAECERLFSLMGRIHTKTRASLTMQSVRDLMLAQSLAVPLALLDVRSCSKYALLRGFGTREVVAKSTASFIDENKFRIFSVMKKSIKKPRFDD
jgi:hypothetical protein